MIDYYETKDKQITPYLLTCPNLKFQGTHLIGDIIYFLFSPKEKAQELAYKFITHQTQAVDPKVLLEAVETYRDIVFEMKEKRRNNEIFNT
jgi:hypothetical protein